MAMLSRCQRAQCRIHKMYDLNVRYERVRKQGVNTMVVKDDAVGAQRGHSCLTTHRRAMKRLRDKISGAFNSFSILSVISSQFIQFTLFLFALSGLSVEVYRLGLMSQTTRNFAFISCTSGLIAIKHGPVRCYDS
jgi:hypothetical protein